MAPRVFDTRQQAPPQLSLWRNGLPPLRFLSVIPEKKLRRCNRKQMQGGKFEFFERENCRNSRKT